MFDEAERIRRVILLALQSNSTGSVLINDGTLGVGIKELKSGAAAPVFKTLSSLLADVLKIVVETVNFVRGRDLNHRIFMQLCKKMESKFHVLPYHTEVLWLSKGKVISRILALRAELMQIPFAEIAKIT